MKKILGLALMVLFIASNCFAMSFSQPVNLNVNASHSTDRQSNGFVFKNVTRNDGHFIKSYGNGLVCYDKGVAQICSENDILYIHYDTGIDAHLHFGGKDYKSTFSILTYMGSEIYKINSNKEITLYLIHTYGELYGTDDYYLLGNLKNNKWVKFFDTISLRETYFGMKPSMGIGPAFSMPKIKSDTITTEYANHIGRGAFSKSVGEFRFKWDESAQWFGVEHIIY